MNKRSILWAKALTSCRSLAPNHWSLQTTAHNRFLSSLCALHDTHVVSSGGRFNCALRQRAGQAGEGERDRTLFGHLCRRLRTRLGFSAEQSRQVAVVCQRALQSHLNSVQSIDSQLEVICSHFAAEDVLFNPQVFLLNQRTLSNRLQILKELCLLAPRDGTDTGTEVRVAEIARSESCFRSLCAQRVLDCRRNGLLVRADVNIVRHLLESSECSDQTVLHKIERAFSAGADVERLTFDAIRRQTIAKYIALRLDVSEDHALSMVDRKSSRIYLTPMRDIVRNIELLVDTCQMPVQRLVRTCSLLTVDAQNVRRIVAQVDRIGGRPLLEVCRKYPKLLDTKCETLVANLNLLQRKYGFSDRQIASAVLVLTLNTHALKQRVLALRNNAEVQLWSDSQRVLRLVLQWNTVLQRLEVLRTGTGTGVRTITVDHLCGSRDYFAKVLLQSAEGSPVSHDSGRQRRGQPLGLTHFCREHMTTEAADGVVRVQCIGVHPNERRFCARNASRVLQFLRDEQHLNNDQLLRGRHLLLYDPSLVRREFERMRSWLLSDHRMRDRNDDEGMAEGWQHREAQQEQEQEEEEEEEWWALARNDSNILQVLLYFIEKSYGFTGNGVYASLP